MFQDFTDSGGFAANRFALWKDGAINFGGIVRPSAAGQVIFTAANVGIGTTAPQYPLSVNGTVQAKEVIVNTTWSDYVFAPTYRLKPLAQVAAYIKDYHHLPDIPSEAEVKEKGVSVGEMQSKLLAKIEELTLHMIQADEINRRLQQQHEELLKRVARLERAQKRHTSANGKGN